MTQGSYPSGSELRKEFRSSFREEKCWSVYGLTGAWSYNGIELPPCDCTVACGAVDLWLRNVYHQLIELRSGLHSIHRFNNLVAAIQQEQDIYKLCRGLDTLYEMLTQNIACTSYNAFKAQYKETSPVYQPIIILLGLQKAVLTEYFATSSAELFRSLIAPYKFLSHLTLKYAPGCEKTAKEKWLASQQQCFETDNIRIWDDDFVKLMQEVNGVITSWFPVSEEKSLWKGFSPHHGSGSTYEGLRRMGDKARILYKPDWMTGLYNQGGFEDIDIMMQNPFQTVITYGCDENGIITSLFLNELMEYCYDPYGSTYCETELDKMLDLDYVLETRHAMSKVQFVPKSWKSYRTVCMESVSVMFAQEGVLSMTQDYIKNRSLIDDLRDELEQCESLTEAQAVLELFASKRLGEHYAIDSDDMNILTAEIGSLNGEYSTWDFSSASDLLTRTHIETAFRGSSLYYPLVMTRTSKVTLIERQTCYPAGSQEDVDLRYIYGEGDGKTKKLLAKMRRKYKEQLIWDTTSTLEQYSFAPMGSATCFIAMTIFFSALCSVVAARHKLNHVSDEQDTSGYLEDLDPVFWVYGDDVVLPGYLDDEFIQACQILGLNLNREKSFYSHSGELSTRRFRESCGGYFFNGIDVTPPIISRKFPGFKLSLKPWERRKIAALVSCANDLYKIKAARNLVVEYLIHVKDLPVIFDDGSRGLYSPNPTNFHLKDLRWNLDTQKLEIRALAISDKSKSDEGSDLCLESARLYSWLLAHPRKRVRNHSATEVSGIAPLSSIDDTSKSIGGWIGNDLITGATYKERLSKLREQTEKRRRKLHESKDPKTYAEWLPLESLRPVNMRVPPGTHFFGVWGTPDGDDEERKQHGLLPIARPCWINRTSVR